MPSLSKSPDELLFPSPLNAFPFLFLFPDAELFSSPSRPRMARSFPHRGRISRRIDPFSHVFLLFCDSCRLAGRDIPRQPRPIFSFPLRPSSSFISKPGHVGVPLARGTARVLLSVRVRDGGFPEHSYKEGRHPLSFSLVVYVHGAPNGEDFFPLS